VRKNLASEDGKVWRMRKMIWEGETLYEKRYEALVKGKRLRNEKDDQGRGDGTSPKKKGGWGLHAEPQEENVARKSASPAERLR